MGIIQLIIDSIFFGFAAYSLAFVLLNFHISFNFKLGENLDHSATLLFRIAGMIYLIIWIIIFNIAITDDEHRLVNRMFGPYWYGFWMYPVTNLGVSQLFWIRKIRNSKAYRIIFSIALLFVMSYEKIVIIVTSLHRDFLPGNLVSFGLTNNMFLNWLVKIGIFGLALFLTDLLVTKRKKAAQ